MQSYADLQGKVAIVTGSGRDKGLGAAIARRLAAEGCKVVIHDIKAVDEGGDETAGLGSAASMEAVAASIRDAGGTCATYACDLLVEADVKSLIDFAKDQFGGVDILVNNAGIGFLVGSVFDMPVEDWDRVMGVNLRAPFLTIKYAGQYMSEQGKGGRIINIASQAAKSGVSLMSAYSSSKHGLIGLTRSAALELGKFNITVNALCPNHVPTDLGNWQRETLSAQRGVTMDSYWERFRQRVPLGRPGAVEDTANACAFLASEQAQYITGEAMNVSGGEEYH